MLGLTLPFDNQFFSIMSNFNHLVSLGLFISNNCTFQLQSLLDKAPRLIELEFLSWPANEIPPFNVTSTSIRRLNFHGCDQFSKRHCFDHQQCIKLSESSLVNQSQVLHIEVEDLLGILELVYKMFNLRTLHVEYRYDSRSHQSDLLELLKRCLSPPATVIRKHYGYFTIQL